LFFSDLFTTIQKIAPSTSTSTSSRWRVQVQVSRYQVQVQVLNLQVQVRVQVPGICTRVVLEYKDKYQELHLWILGHKTGDHECFCTKFCTVAVNEHHKIEHRHKSSFRKANVADGRHLEFQKVIIIQSWTEILACNFARWLILPVETTPSGTFCFHIDTFPIQLLSTVYTKKLRWTIYLWSGFRNGFRFLTIKRATINVFAPNFVQWRKINSIRWHTGHKPSLRNPNVADGRRLQFQKVIIIQSWTEIFWHAILRAGWYYR